MMSGGKTLLCMTAGAMMTSSLLTIARQVSGPMGATRSSTRTYEPPERP